MTDELVLVTGGSGFVGSHCIVALLDAGYVVRTTVRSLAREQEVRDMVAAGGAGAGNRLQFVAADLTADARLGRGGGRLHLRPARGLAVPARGPPGRERADRAGP